MKRDLKNPLAPTFSKKNGGGDDPTKKNKKKNDVYVNPVNAQLESQNIMFSTGIGDNVTYSYEGTLPAAEKKFKKKFPHSKFMPPSKERYYQESSTRLLKKSKK